MSESSETTKQTTDIESDQRFIAPDADWFMQELVRFSNEYGIEMGITIQVGGCIISGTIVSGKKYFEEFSSAFASGFKTNPDLGEPFKKLIESYKEIYTKQPLEEDQNAPPQVSYIHLSNARFFAPGQKPIPDSPGSLWRGRISEIGGFFLGILS